MIPQLLPRIRQDVSQLLLDFIQYWKSNFLRRKNDSPRKSTLLY